jgi:hypothetical protein
MSRRLADTWFHDRVVPSRHTSDTRRWSNSSPVWSVRKRLKTKFCWPIDGPIDSFVLTDVERLAQFGFDGFSSLSLFSVFKSATRVSVDVPPQRGQEGRHWAASHTHTSQVALLAFFSFRLGGSLIHSMMEPSRRRNQPTHSDNDARGQLLGRVPRTHPPIRRILANVCVISVQFIPTMGHFSLCHSGAQSADAA